MTRSTILLTRPEADCIALSNKLEEKGFNVVHSPMLEIRNINIPFDIDATNYDALIFTSKNAVKSFLKQTPDPNTTIQTYAVGPGTAAELKNNGFENIHFSTQSNAGALINEIQKNIQSHKKYLYLRGKHISVNVKQILEQQNVDVQVDEATLYESITNKSIHPDAKSKLIKGEIDYIAFFSERTAKAFNEVINGLELNRTLFNTKCLCFSDKVLCSVSNLNWQSTHTCKTPTLDSMMNLIDEIETNKA